MSSKEQLTRTAQEETLEVSETSEKQEEFSQESVAKLVASKETALIELKERSIKETARFEAGFAQSAKDLGGTPEDIASVTQKIEQIETHKETVIEGARKEIAGSTSNVEIKEPAIKKADIVEITRDRNFEGSVIVKVKGEEDRITGYAIRKNSHGNLEGNEIKYMEDGSVGPVYQLHESDFSLLREQGVLDAYENIPTMKERIIKDPELLDEKESSKRFLAEERKKLAQEIREQRKAQRNKLSALKDNLEMANNSESLESGLESEQYARLSEMQSIDANEIADRISSSELNEQEAPIERENLGQLIANSESVKSLKVKLENHYAKADAIAQQKFESIRKTVEQTMLRNDTFIVHTFLLREELRHNENSNISQRATLEDDIDILLSLEPSISTSSIVPGSRQGLWGERIGVVLGGGDIRGVLQTDDGTVTGGIKMRYGEISSSREIDEKVSDRGERGYNELVVNNPEVFGFFQSVQNGESGKMVGFQRTESVQTNRNRKDDFMKYINLAIEKGMPPLIMTPDRKLFEFASIDDDGVVSVGSEITPEQVAKGKAGLANEKRTEIGEQIITKNLFKNIEDQKEAKGIIAGLSGQEGSKIELSREEYVAYARDNQGRLYDFPKNLLGDKEFISEIAEFDPVSTYKYAGEELKKDIEFIKHIYSLEKTRNTDSVYANMPEDLRKDEAVALLAIENNDFDRLDGALTNSSLVYEKLVDKMVDKINPNRWFSRQVGEGQYIEPDLYMGGVNLSDRFVSDEDFIRKLNDKYSNFKFEVNEYKQLLVTKLS